MYICGSVRIVFHGLTISLHTNAKISYLAFSRQLMLNDFNTKEINMKKINMNEDH